MASCTFRFRSIPSIQKIGFLFFSLTYLPLCPSLSFSQCHLCLPLALSLCPSPSPSTLFSHTIIERYFPSSPGLSVLAHKGTNMACTFRTISRRTFEFQCKEYLFSVGRLQSVNRTLNCRFYRRRCLYNMSQRVRDIVEA